MRPVLRSVLAALVVVVWLLAAAALAVRAEEDTHTYHTGDPINVYASKIGPIDNPLETYDFFKEPGCPPASWDMKPPTLGQALAGDELYPTKMTITFGHVDSNTPVCLFTPTEEQLERWTYMVENQYSYKLTIDGLPVWAAFGVVASGNPHVYTHHSFFIGVNENQIVNVSLKMGKPLPVEADSKYTFTYSVRFFESKVTFENRYAVYADQKAIRPRVRWFSITNAVLIAIFLSTVVLIIISRTLKADLAKMDEERRLRFEGHDTLDDSGWKQLFADVFRIPRSPALLAATTGSGTQLYVLLVLTMFVAAVDSSNPVVGDNRAGFAVVVYAITSFIGGYVSSSEFARFSVLSPPLAKHWTRCLGLTQVLLPGLFFACTLFTNTIASMYGSAQVIHFGSLSLLLIIWLLVSCPLSLVGTFLGRYMNRRTKRRNDIPHINQIPRLIPRPRHSYTRPLVLFLVSGLLPFVSVFVEVNLLISSFWQDKPYQLYGLLALALFIFTVVTMCGSVAATFILLNTENHQWRWMSFSFGASCAVYIFLYTVYYFLFKTKMSGLFMTAFYFSYSTFFCAVIACVGGSLSYAAAGIFVSRIYTQAKRD